MPKRRDLATEAPLFQIPDGALALGSAAQLLLKVPVGLLQCFKLPLDRLFPLLVGRAAFRAGNVDAGELGQLLYRRGKVEAVIFHQKAERIASGAAAETVVELLVGADRKGGGFLLVEGAEAA